MTPCITAGPLGRWTSLTNPIEKHSPLIFDIDLILPAARVIRTLEQLEEIHGLPKALRLDYRSELRSAVFMGWHESKGIDLKFIQPCKLQKMPLLSILTALTVMKSVPISLKILIKSRTSLSSGSRFTMRIVLMQHQGSCHLYTIDNKQNFPL